MNFMLGFTREQVRDADRRAIEEFGVPPLLLMENAGRGAAELLQSLGIHGPVAICCGKGNNGGDGMVMARHLHNHAIDVAIHLFAEPDELKGDAAVHWRIVCNSGIANRIWNDPELPDLTAAFKRPEWIVDALFGTGLQGPIRSPLDRVVGAMNASPAQVFAIDIPSGLDCDTGEPLGATIRARHTATLLAPKKGYENPAARAWTGRVHVIDIGAPRALLTPN
jgi:NAD(P)H-hydrate epimerase